MKNMIINVANKLEKIASSLNYMKSTTSFLVFDPKATKNTFFATFCVVFSVDLFFVV